MFCRARWLHLIIAGISFAFLLFLSWHKWGNLIVDTFRDPWTFAQLAEGKVLYKDVFYLYGFLPPYFASFLFKIFGVHLDCLVFTGILITAAVYFLVYRISRFFLNRYFSVLCALGFLFIHAFGFYNYLGVFNFILPYSLASTFFIFFLLCSILFFLKFIKTDKTIFLLIWACSLWLAFLCRIDFSFLVWLVFVFLGLLYGLRNKKAVLLILPLALSFATYYLFLSLTGGFEGFRESFSDIFLFCASAKNKVYFFDSGLANIPLNLKYVLGSFIYQLSAILLFIVLSVAFSSLRNRFKGKITLLLAYIFLTFCSFFSAFCLVKFLGYQYGYRLMPVVLISGIILFFSKCLSAKGDDLKKNFSFLVLFLISFVLILRKLFLVSPNHYGFFLAFLSLICYFIFFIKIPGLLFNKLRSGKENGLAKKCYLFLFFLYFIFISCAVVGHSLRNYNNRQLVISTDRGTIISFDDLPTARFCKAVDYLKGLPEGSKVVVFPEGVGLNFFSLKENPLRYSSFLPEELSVIGEDNVIGLLDKYKIDYIVILSRKADYTAKSFGIDYGKKIYAWIQEKYKLEFLIGPYPFSRDEFGIAIFSRSIAP